MFVVTFGGSHRVLPADGSQGGSVARAEEGSPNTVDLGRTARDLHHKSLWLRARAGHEASFRALYRALYGPVFGYARRRLGDETDAEDVTARVFHRFVEQLDRYEPERGSLWTWIMTLARHAVVDHWRARRPDAVSIDGLADVLASGHDTPLERLLRREDEQLLHTVLRTEPDATREIFALHLVEGMTHREIARVMGLREDAVKQRYARAKRRLRAATNAERTEPDLVRDVRGRERTAGERA